MASRILPEPDRRTVCPNHGRVLDFYESAFEAVYVLLHPFIRPTAMSCDQFLEAEGLTRHEVCKTCVPVSWSEVRLLSGLTSFAEVDIALRTQIKGLGAGFANEVFLADLRSAMDSQGILPPVEGEFSELTHDGILSFLQRQGYEWVWVGDEFGSERKLHWIDDLKSADSTATEGLRNVFTPDHKILWTTHWDSHFSFFCGSHELVERMSLTSAFEGFQCDERTEVYWSVHGA